MVKNQSGLIYQLKWKQPEYEMLLYGHNKQCQQQKRLVIDNQIYRLTGEHQGLKKYMYRKSEHLIQIALSKKTGFKKNSLTDR